MSACISQRGEYSSHELDDEQTCKWCGVFDEEAFRRINLAAAEARGRQQMIDALRDEAKKRRGFAERDGTHTPVLQAEAMEWLADQHETPTPPETIMATLDFTIIVEPDNSEPGWWIWEVSRYDDTRIRNRHILAESSSRWRWLAIARALHLAWLSRNNRYADNASDPA